ncbi:hypothetical protein AURDEDRAFT_173513 [Auricularia subglabra TFB-10046 SS5]|nr:hypothetical protein AURDEDRAFT_173513 [Auricularia subglabra TFB-10046 SS5]
MSDPLPQDDLPPLPYPEAIYGLQHAKAVRRGEYNAATTPSFCKAAPGSALHTPRNRDVDVRGDELYRFYDVLSRPGPPIGFGKRSASRRAPHSPPRRHERLPGHLCVLHMGHHPQLLHPHPHPQQHSPASSSSGSPPASSVCTPASATSPHAHAFSAALNRSLERRRVREIVSVGFNSATPSRAPSPEREYHHHHAYSTGTSPTVTSRLSSGRTVLARRGSGGVSLGMGMTPIHLLTTTFGGWTAQHSRAPAYPSSPVAPSPSLGARDDTLAVVVPLCRTNAKPRRRRTRRAAGWFAALAFGTLTDPASKSLRSTLFTRSGWSSKDDGAPPYGELSTSTGVASVGDGVSFGGGTSSTSRAGAVISSFAIPSAFPFSCVPPPSSHRNFSTPPRTASISRSRSRADMGVAALSWLGGALLARPPPDLVERDDKRTAHAAAAALDDNDIRRGNAVGIMRQFPDGFVPSGPGLVDSEMRANGENSIHHSRIPLRVPYRFKAKRIDERVERPFAPITIDLSNRQLVFTGTHARRLGIPAVNYKCAVMQIPDVMWLGDTCELNAQVHVTRKSFLSPSRLSIALSAADGTWRHTVLPRFLLSASTSLGELGDLPLARLASLTVAEGVLGLLLQTPLALSALRALYIAPRKSSRSAGSLRS